MFKKLSIIIILIMTFSLVLMGCSSNEQGSSPSEENQKNEKKTSEEQVVIKLAYVMQESHSSHITLRDIVKPYIEKESNGRLKLELYPNGQLGGERQGVEATQLGTIQMTIVTSSTLAGFQEKFQVFDLPYLFKSKEAAYSALDGELGQKVNKTLEPLGIINLAYAENGFRHVSNNRNPIEKPEDLNGLKIRTMETPAHMAAFRKLGANPTPMNFNELYTALQQGTVDAQENPVALVYTSKFYEVQDYYSLTGHVYTPAVVLINSNFYNNLPEDLQKIVTDGFIKYRDEQRKLSTKQDEEFLVKLKEEGMKVNELSDEQKEKFIKATLSVYDDYIEVLGEDLINLAKQANK